MTVIRVFIAEDHTVVRKALRALLEMEPDLEVIGEAADGRSAVTETARLRPDVVLMDLAMPGGDGVEAIRAITSGQDRVRVLVLTSFATSDRVLAAIKAGAHGYLLKDSSPEDLIRAIHQVYRNEASLSPRIAREVLREIRQPHDDATRPGGPGSLTAREVEVLRLVARGLSNLEIAARISLSEPTVRSHVSAILGKLHLASRTQAALFALREGLANLHEPDDSP